MENPVDTLLFDPKRTLRPTEAWRSPLLIPADAAAVELTPLRRRLLRGGWRPLGDGRRTLGLRRTEEVSLKLESETVCWPEVRQNNNANLSKIFL